MITKSDLDKLNAKDPKLKYGFAKELLKIALEKPEQLYPHLDVWTNLMTGDNSILKWTAIDIIGYLSAVDSENRVEALIPDLIKHLHGSVLITANHAIFALGLIAQHKPAFKEKIISELKAISHDQFQTEECKKIATGKVIFNLHFFSKKCTFASLKKVLYEK
jgi:hypothetical protein